MKKRLLLFIFSLSAAFAYSQDNLVVIDNPKGDDYIQGRINLKVKPEFRAYFESLKNTVPGFEALAITGLRRKFPTRKPLENQYHESGRKLPDLSLIYELDYSAEQDGFKTAEQLLNSGYFDYAEPHYVSYQLYTPNDAMLPVNNPYHFITMQLYDAWDIQKGDSNIVIGYTDTSFDINHPDMSGNVKYNYADTLGNGDDEFDGYPDNFAGWDMVDNDNTFFINNEIHGTTVAAVGSATGDNNTGYLGSGFKCKFLPVKVANSSQVVTKGYEGITYCVDHGCKIVNCSWGNTTFNQLAQDVTDDAILSNDVVIVASAGNIPYDTAYYPASYRFVLSVSGVDNLDRFDPPANPPFSWNDSVDVTAPGFDVFTTATYGGNTLYSPPQGGTSIAAPLVAGVAGLVRSQFPNLTALQVVERIKCTTDNIDAITENIPYAGKIGTGRVNAFAALSTNNQCGLVTVSQQKAEESILIYPNPANDVLSIYIPSMVNGQQATVNILNATAQLVYQSTINNQRLTFNTSSFAAGIYYCAVKTDETTFSKKIVVVR